VEEVEATGLEGPLDDDRGQESEEDEEGHEDCAGLYDEGVGVMGLLQDLHPHAELGLANSFALL
jgi:hypothetical protein